MNLNELVDIIYIKSNPYHKSSKQTAKKHFHDMMNHYNLNEKFLKKGDYEDATYDVTEIELDFLRFAYDIYCMDPEIRANSSPENFSLANYRTIANYIKYSIKKKRYPLIQTILSKSVSTEEFFSIDLLQSLSCKTAEIFAFAATNNHIDYTVYEDLNKYLDKLLYTYSIYNKIPELVEKWSDEDFTGSKKIVAKAYINSKNRVASFRKKGSSYDHIKMFTGISSYISRVYYDIVDPPMYYIGKNGAKLYETKTNIKNLSVTYDFDNITELQHFLKSYVSITDTMYRSYGRFLGITSEELHLITEHVNGLTYLIKSSAFKNRTKKYEHRLKVVKQYEKLLWRTTDLIVICLLKHKNSMLKDICKECTDCISEIDKNVSKYLSTESTWIQVQYNYATSSLINTIDIFHSTFLREYLKPLDTNNEPTPIVHRKNYEINHLALLCKTSYLILNLFICSALFLHYSDDIRYNFQFRYKGFIFQLDHLFTPYSNITLNSANNRIDELIQAINDSENKITSFNGLIDEVNGTSDTKKESDLLMLYIKELIQRFDKDIGKFFRNAALFNQNQKKSSDKESS